MKPSYINAKDAPQPDKASSPTARAALETIKGLKPGKVAAITLEEGETIRAIKTSLTRVAKNNNYQIRTWDMEGVVYVALAEETTTDKAD